MKFKFKIEFDDGKILELSEKKARELYLKLGEYFCSPFPESRIKLGEYSCSPFPEPRIYEEPIIEWPERAPEHTPSYPIITCQVNDGC
ncbi:MAG: hypothetical protein GY853_01835 [PVC group bacterium]|nr:hypothetical protein [PVC group bacterium]